MDRLRILDSIFEVEPSEWNRQVAGASPVLRWEWLASLESSGCVSKLRDWLPRHLVLEQEGRVIGLCPLYMRSGNQGEFIWDGDLARLAGRSGLRTSPRGLVGVPFTPVMGPRLLAEELPNQTSLDVRKRLVMGLLGLLEEQSWASLHIHFCSRADAELFGDLGFVVRKGWQYHWRNPGYRDFEDFLGCFDSGRRNKIRRELRAPIEQGLRLSEIGGDQVESALFSSMARLYADTSRRNGKAEPLLTEAFFEQLGERMPSLVRFQVARSSEGIVGLCLNLEEKDRLYGRYWGCELFRPFLHFNLAYYAGIKSCIDRGLEAFDPGHGGAFKLSRGFEPVLVFSAHHYTDPVLHTAVEAWAERESHWVETRLQSREEHSPLRSFRN